MSLVSNAARRIVRMPALRSKSVAPVASFSSLSAASKPAQSSRSTRYIAAAAFAAMGLSAVAIYSTQSALMDNTETHPSAGLDPKNFLPLKLKSVEPYNYNTKVYHFALPDPNTPLDLPVSSAVVCRYMGEDGKPVIRPYTPIDTHIPGEVILLVKEYEKGIMSKHIANMKVGDTLDIKGPIPKLKYTPNMKKKIGFLVGGTGVTPAMQVINEVLRNPEDKTELYLLFANVSPRDILLKETIDKWAAAHKNFHVTYFIDNHHEDWKGEVGRIDQKAIEKTLPIKASEGNDVLIYACGPPAFYENVSGSKAKDYTQGEVGGALARMGFTKDQVYKF